jgi:hypothetical protein
MASALAACGSSTGKPLASESKNAFVLSEFTIRPPTTPLHAGRISIRADNVGGEPHELVIVRADSVSALPMKSDGSVNEAKLSKSELVAKITSVAPNSQKTRVFDLKAGTYVALCNIADSMSGMDHGSGHIHFARGMYAPFEVS